jgi:hypothetical protein
MKPAGNLMSVRILLSTRTLRSLRISMAWPEVSNLAAHVVRAMQRR